MTYIGLIALKAFIVAVPVSTIFVGTALYVINRRGDSNHIDQTYLIVKPKGNESSSLPNEYLCKVDESIHSIIDEGCQLYKLNTLTNNQSIQLDFSLKNDQLVKTSESISDSSFYLLKVTEKMYRSRYGSVGLYSKDNPSVKALDLYIVSNIKGNHKELPWQSSSNLFLGRLNTVANSLDMTKNDYKCHLGHQKLPCKIYQFPNLIKGNNLVSDKPLTLKALSASGNKVGKFVVVDLLANKKNFLDLKNQKINIKAVNKKNIDDAFEIAFDQQLYGFVNSDYPGQSAIFPVLSKRRSYVVKQEVAEGETSFDDIDSSTKNYHCKLLGIEDQTIDNYDTSCELSVFPNLNTEEKVYEILGDSATKPTKAAVNFTPVTPSNIGTKKWFKLEIDRLRLYNLGFTDTSDGEFKVMVLPNDKSNKSLTLSIKHQLKPNKVVGKSNILLVKAVGEDVSLSNPNFSKVQCSFIAIKPPHPDSQSCWLHKNSKSDLQDTDLNKVVVTSANPTSNTIANDDYYVIELSEPIIPSQFKYFNIHAFIPVTGNEEVKTQVTFLIKALLAGQIADKQHLYFVEKYGSLPTQIPVVSVKT